MTVSSVIRLFASRYCVGDLKLGCSSALNLNCGPCGLWRAVSEHCTSPSCGTSATGQYYTIHDRKGGTHWLILPTKLNIRGIEDAAKLSYPDDLWDFAWQVVAEGPMPQPQKGYWSMHKAGLIVNGVHKRTQHHLHLHINHLLPHWRTNLNTTSIAAYPSWTIIYSSQGHLIASFFPANVSSTKPSVAGAEPFRLGQLLRDSLSQGISGTAPNPLPHSGLLLAASDAGQPPGFFVGLLNGQLSDNNMLGDT